MWPLVMTGISSTDLYFVTCDSRVITTKVVVVCHQNQPHPWLFPFALVLCESLWLWLMVGWSFKSQSIIGLALGLRRIKVITLPLLALDRGLKMVATSTFSPELGLEAL